MADNANIKEFPDVNQKLAAPKRLSAFEKDRLAAQAKEKRAEAENAAALKAFEESFAEEDDEDSLSQLGGSRLPPSGPRGPSSAYGGTEGMYAMPPGGPRSGPGSLPAPPSLKRKRALDEMREAEEARREQEEMLGPEDSIGDLKGTPQTRVEDERPDIDASRPTVQLTSLPPGISSDEIKSILRDHLSVHSLRLIPPIGPGSDTKRSMSAIATLSSETSASQIDAAVTALKDRYLGCGFYLSISRHLSSAALHSAAVTITTAQPATPFGAEKASDANARISLRNAPPPVDQREFAPPDSYDMYDAAPPRPGYEEMASRNPSIAVRPPLGIAAIKAVHMVVDQLLLEPDPQRALEFEAMLMARPEVQSDERFAFLFDSKSPAGVYYRFLLWSPEDQDEAVREMQRGSRGSEIIHEDIPIEWATPYVPFPDLKSMSEVVADADYISSDEESDDEGRERQFNSARDGDGVAEDDKKHLTPLQHARLIHMLSRLPTAITRLRKGDIARVTYFAINHAGQSAEEIVDILLLNVERPFSYSLASKYEESDQEQDEEDVYEPDENLSELDAAPTQEPRDDKRDEDPSNAKLIALYLISDILSASSTAGARNAWKYRQLFETGFKAQKTFEHLGKLDKEIGWGRMKMEQWKRKVEVVLGIWEDWSAFGTEAQGELKKSFFEPPLSEEEKATAQAEAEREEKRKLEEKMTKFKSSDQTGSASPAPAPVPAIPKKSNDDVNGTSREDAYGSMMDVDGNGRSDETNGGPAGEGDGAPATLANIAPLDGFDGAADEKPKSESNTSISVSALGPDGKPTVRRRMRAEDMFADSDDE